MKGRYLCPNFVHSRDGSFKFTDQVFILYSSYFFRSDPAKRRIPISLYLNFINYITMLSFFSVLSYDNVNIFISRS